MLADDIVNKLSENKAYGMMQAKRTSKVLLLMKCLETVLKRYSLAVSQVKTITSTIFINMIFRIQAEGMQLSNEQCRKNTQINFLSGFGERCQINNTGWKEMQKGLEVSQEMV